MKTYLYKSHITYSDTRRGLWKAVKKEIGIISTIFLLALILLAIAIKSDSARFKREADPTNDLRQQQNLPLITPRG